MTYAFRCRNCGRLVEAGAAGDNATPHACPVCDAGIEYVNNLQEGKAAVAARRGCGPDDLQHISFHHRFHKIVDAANWEILAQATAERLREIGLERSQVEAHVPANAANGRQARLVEATGVEGVGVNDIAS